MGGRSLVWLGVALVMVAGCGSDQQAAPAASSDATEPTTEEPAETSVAPPTSSTAAPTTVTTTSTSAALRACPAVALDGAEPGPAVAVLRSIDLAGQILWEAPLDGMPNGVAVVDADSIMVANADITRLTVIDRQTCDVLHTVELEALVYFHPPQVISSDSDGAMVAYDLGSGEQLWERGNPLGSGGGQFETIFHPEVGVQTTGNSTDHTVFSMETGETIATVSSISTAGFDVDSGDGVFNGWAIGGSGLYIFGGQGLEKHDFSGATAWHDPTLTDIESLHISIHGVGLAFHDDDGFTAFDLETGSVLGSGNDVGPDNVGVFAHGLVIVDDGRARLTDLDGRSLAEIEHGSSAREAVWRRQRFLLVRSPSDVGWLVYDSNLELVVEFEATSTENVDLDGSAVFVVGSEES